MKDTVNDEKLKKFLTDNARQADENPTFTRRVLNRLPERNRSTVNWGRVAVYVVMAVLCLVGWIIFGEGEIFDNTQVAIGNGYSISTNLLAGIVLVMVTAGVGLDILYQALRSE